MGLNLFQNFAFLSAFLIFYYEWSQGNELEMASTVSTLALVFFLFVSVNQLAYSAIFQVANFMAILDRIGSVLRLEEFKSGDSHDNHDTNRAANQ